jgi:hypothetical protein
MAAVRARMISIAAGMAACLTVISSPASAELLITVDKTTQHMIVAQDGVPLYDWPVSTGRRGYDTPSGLFQPFRMEADHFSREWDDAPMPHSIFFTQIGHAIHGSFERRHLGSAASHGCVRLSPEHAAILFKLVRKEKMANTRVLLTGEIPGGAGKEPHRLGVDPYAADEALVGWHPAAPDVEVARVPEKPVVRAAKRSSRPARSARRYDRDEGDDRYDRGPFGFADLFFSRDDDR